MFAYTDKPHLPTYKIKTKMMRLDFLVLICSLFIYENDSKISLQSMAKIKSYMQTKIIVAEVKKNAVSGVESCQLMQCAKG